MNGNRGFERLRRGFPFLTLAALYAPILAYGLYLLALGPFWAIDGRFGVVSEPVRAAIWWPAKPLFDVPVVIYLFEGYLECWYVDPNAAETTR